MRRIQPPSCTVCGYSRASYESDVWSTLKLCSGCRQTVIDYFLNHQRSTVHKNPFLFELASGALDCQINERVYVFHFNNDSTGEFYQKFSATRPDESEIEIENPLDFLDGL